MRDDHAFVRIEDTEMSFVTHASKKIAVLTPPEKRIEGVKRRHGCSLLIVKPI
jgi:hypothetical protein